MWLTTAIFSAVFAAITSIFAKCGIKKTDSDLATALRTVVVFIFSLIMANIVGSLSEISAIDKKSLIFLILSGLATGISWICYFKALSIGDINKVVPIDKSSSIIGILLAIICFGETNHLWIKLAGTAIFGLGVVLMSLKKHSESTSNNSAWLPYAVMSAVFAALTSILAKIGISNVESNLSVAVRTFVVLIMAWSIVAFKGKLCKIKDIDKSELGFIFLSGMATGASWLCYYYAIQNGIVSAVVPIDKMSIVPTVIFSRLVFKEKLSKTAFIGLCMMIVGTLVITIWA